MKDDNYGFQSYSTDFSKDIPDNKESVSSNEYVKYGEDNKFPQYLWKLYENCTTLQSVIDGIQLYILGNEINFNSEEKSLNDDGETIREILETAVLDRMIFGGFAIQVIYDGYDKPVQYINLPFDKCRIDKEKEYVYYSEEWGKKSSPEAIKYPTSKVKGKQTSRVLYYVGKKTRKTYPVCPFNGAIKSTETQIEIGNFHYNSIKNNFMPSVVISFNNGIPPEDVQKEIGNKIRECTGTNATSKVFTTFNKSKENAAEIQKLSEDNFDKRYEALSKSTRENIFIAFRATPILFGLSNDTKGFSKSEYKEAFELFNQTVINPIQTEIENQFKKINLDFTFEPFKIIDNDKEETTNE